jgi:hypothetical protein
MKPFHPRPPRYAFVAQVQITDLDSETTVHGVTNDLTLFGFSVTVNIPLAVHCLVQVRLAHRKANCAVQGRVVRVDAEGQMGIAITS